MQIFLAWETYHQRRTAASPDTSPFLVPVGGVSLSSHPRPCHDLHPAPRTVAVACLQCLEPNFWQGDFTCKSSTGLFMRRMQGRRYEVWPPCFAKQRGWLQGVSRCYWVMYEIVSASLRLWLWTPICYYLKTSTGESRYGKKGCEDDIIIQPPCRDTIFVIHRIVKIQ